MTRTVGPPHSRRIGITAQARSNALLDQTYQVRTKPDSRLGTLIEFMNALSPAELKAAKQWLNPAKSESSHRQAALDHMVRYDRFTAG
ncbi:MAG: hypothetical protein ACKN9W_19355 [Methylococcus sp.]